MMPEDGLDVPALLQSEFALERRPDPADNLWIDLRLDSLAAIELLALLEDLLERELSDDVLSSWDTVSDLQAFMDGAGGYG
jgi:acyl carrier protein